MPESVTLRRGEATPSMLSDALDQLRVEDGADFTIAAANGDLPTHPRARSTDPSTAHRAWLENLPRAGSQRDRILRALALVARRGGGILTASLRSGLTAGRVAEVTGLPLNSVSTRCSELKAGGWIEVADTARTAQGARAEVYVLTPKGRDHLG